MDLCIAALDGIVGWERDFGTRVFVMAPAGSSLYSKFQESSLPP